MIGRDVGPLVWLRGEVKTPPVSAEARLEAGVLLRRLQQAEGLAMPTRGRCRAWAAMPRVRLRLYDAALRDD